MPPIIEKLRALSASGRRTSNCPPCRRRPPRRRHPFPPRSRHAHHRSQFPRPRRPRPGEPAGAHRILRPHAATERAPHRPPIGHPDRKMAEHGHNSVLEMGVLTLRVDCSPEAVSALFLPAQGFLQIDRPAADRLLVSGSVHAFPRDAHRAPGRPHLPRHRPVPRPSPPVLPSGSYRSMPMPPRPMASPSPRCRFTEVEQFPVDRLARHRHLAVKFIVNRAVTHEALVRHRPAPSSRKASATAAMRTTSSATRSPSSNRCSSPRSTRNSRYGRPMAAMERRYLRLLETSSA